MSTIRVNWLLDYAGAAPDAEFREITVDYPIEFARVLRASSPGAAFSFLRRRR